MKEQSALWSEIQKHGFATRLVGYKNDEEGKRATTAFNIGAFRLKMLIWKKATSFIKAKMTLCILPAWMPCIIFLTADDGRSNQGAFRKRKPISYQTFFFVL